MATTRASWETAYRELDAALKSAEPANAPDLPALEEIRVRFMGRKGALTELLKSLKDLSIDDKRELGPKANELKTALDSKIAARQRELEIKADEASLSGSSIDVSLPGLRPARGRLHPLTQTLDEMTSVLSLMGFSWADGPLVETDDHNFTKLNIPEHHSARDMHDTFYLSGVPRLLRTHTSPVQIRTMESHDPPLRIMAPGRVFRHEAVDATHSAVFHQVEGLYVDKNVTFADLKGTLTAFMKKMLGAKTQMRFRPSYFPFTEPSTEVDVSCFFCVGVGCAICKQSGWIELLGAGLVHPNVFKAVGYDPEEWSGFAFGIGVERLAMLRLRVKDIRHFYENDARFLRQFDETLV
jgi:phenylalanyl-tRNA synthetase alpha chain